MDLYDRINQLLKEQKLTRRKLSEDTGISYNTLTSLFSRRSENIDVSTAVKIAHYLGVTIDFILTGSDKPSALINNGIIGNANRNNTITVTNGGTHTRELSEIEAELLRICAKLDIRKKVELLTYASDLEKRKD